jgi:hypothetical protein
LGRWSSRYWLFDHGHEVIVAPGHDLGRRGDRRKQIAQHRVLFWVMPHESGRLREAPEVVGADIVLVDFGLALARGALMLARAQRNIEPLDTVERFFASRAPDPRRA